jgi:pimeloyl-ACP methyl ester carboxylesterase
VSSSRTIWILAAWLLVAACAREAPAPSSPPPAPILPASADKKCVVLLHGKGGGALPSSVNGGIEYLRPGGNGEGWGGREWRYFPGDRYDEVRAAITTSIDAAGCGRAVVQGFSNGGAAAARLYCAGEDFGNRVIGYIVDDPVPDGAVIGCQPRTGVKVALYWTGGLSMATDGWSCASQDWTCEGGRTIGIARYARELGVDAAPSIHTTHAEYAAPPEAASWLGDGLPSSSPAVPRP